jgi:IclR family pca regulon transcriptional regulator
MDAEPDKPGEYVEGLARGIAILESFDVGHPEMTLSDVARRCGLSPAAARRGLLTLVALGYVGQRDKRFHLRPKVMSLGSTFYFSARIGEALQPELRSLVETFGDAASIGTLDGADVVYIASVSVQRARRAAAVIGARYPAHATSIGRVLLAGLPPEELDAHLASGGFERLTSKTVCDPCALRAEIANVREEGFSTTVDQLDYGITALAVPIRGADGRWIAGLNTSGYTGMVTPEELVEERLPQLRATASRIGAAIAATPVIETIIGT